MTWRQHIGGRGAAGNCVPLTDNVNCGFATSHDVMQSVDLL